jgi:ATP-dependent Clp protease adaptor protein ClpS
MGNPNDDRRPHSGHTTREHRQAQTEPRADRLPPFRVLLHNDNVNGMAHVVQTLLNLTPLNVHGATRVMMEAHNTGVALMLVTHRERAELYQEQFASSGLTVTIEPAAG